MSLKIGFTYNVAKAVGFGQPKDLYAEFDSPKTINAIKDALSTKGEVYPIEADEDAYDKLKKLSDDLDIVFNIAEGIRGESRESQIPAMLEMLGIPYTGSGPLTLAIALDKARTHEILNCYGVPSPQFQVMRSAKDKLRTPFPVIIKPISEGSSKGIAPNSFITGEKELKERVSEITSVYGQPAIVEEFLSGREFTVAVLGNEELRTFPIVEIYIDKYPKEAGGIYCFEAKTKWEQDSFSGHAKLDSEMAHRIIQMALDAHRALNCMDFSRIDIRMDAEGKPKVLEVNPIPGLNPDIKAVSYFPKAARLGGMSHKELVTTMLSYALKRYGINGSEEGKKKRI